MSLAKTLPKFKIVLIGDAGVGKTNLLNRILVNDFNPYTKSTIGVEFSSKTIDIDDIKITAQIWDTAGTERYHSLSKSFYRQSMGAFLVYDVTDRTSFISLRKWLKEFKSMALPDAYLIVIGNKCDSHERQVTYAEGKKFAQDNKCSFFETSSLANMNIHESFDHMIQELYNLHKDKLLLLEDTINQSMTMGSLKTSSTYSEFSGTNSLKLSNQKMKDNKKMKCC